MVREIVKRDTILIPVPLEDHVEGPTVVEAKVRELVTQAYQYRSRMGWTTIVMGMDEYLPSPGERLDPHSIMYMVRVEHRYNRPA